MRLTAKEISILKRSLESINSEAQLFLFGSRTDDTKKGGDIDLLVLSDSISMKDLRKLRLDFYKEFGEQKMDIILDDGSFEDPFHKLIFKKAVKL